MSENKRGVPTTRSLATDAALVATPLAIAAQPLISAWADQHIGQGDSQSEPQPQQQQQQQQHDS